MMIKWSNITNNSQKIGKVCKWTKWFNLVYVNCFTQKVGEKKIEDGEFLSNQRLSFLFFNKVISLTAYPTLRS